MKYKLICRMCDCDEFFSDLANTLRCKECGGVWFFEDMRYKEVEENEI